MTRSGVTRSGIATQSGSQSRPSRREPLGVSNLLGRSESLGGSESLGRSESGRLSESLGRTESQDPSRVAGRPTCGVLLVGHGTRDDRGTDEFFRLAERLRPEVAPWPVACGLLEFQRPTIADGWRALVAQGVTHVRVAPLLLFAAGHAKSDVPGAIAECRDAHRDPTFDQAGPLSRHPAILRLLLRRLAETIGDDLSGERYGVVLVGRGSHDPCAQADLRLLAELVRHRSGLSPSRFATAFYAMAEPRLPEVLDRLIRDGCSTVVVQPHLLFHGRLYQAIARQCREASERNVGARVICGPYLGVDEAVAQAVAARLLTRDARGQCQD